MGRIRVASDYEPLAKYESKAKGAIYVDGVEVASTLQCAHCGGHFVSKIGSGHTRGFCSNCQAPLCGAPECLARCRPFEKWLDEVEKKGRTG